MIRRLLAVACLLSLLPCTIAPAARDDEFPKRVATTRPTTALAEPRILARLRGHGGLFVGYSPDGSRILTIGKMDLQLWDARTFEPVGSAVEYPGDFVSAGFAAGGQVAHLAHEEGVWLFDAQTGARIGPGVKAPSPVWAAAVSPDGRAAAVACVGPPYQLAEPLVHLFDTISGREVRRLRLGDNGVYAAFSPDGQSLLTAEGGGMAFRTFRVWDLTTGRERFAPILARASFNNPAGAMQSPGVFSPNGRRFAVVAGDGAAVFDAMTGRRVAGDVPGEIGEAADDLQFASDGGRLLVVRSGHAVLCDPATAKAPFEAVPEHIDYYSLSPDGTRLAAAFVTDMRARDWKMQVGVFDLLSGRRLFVLGGVSDAGPPAFAPAGDQIAVSGTGTSKEDTTVWSVVAIEQ